MAGRGDVGRPILSASCISLLFVLLHAIEKRRRRLRIARHRHESHLSLLWFPWTNTRFKTAKCKEGGERLTCCMEEGFVVEGKGEREPIERTWKVSLMFFNVTSKIDRNHCLQGNGDGFISDQLKHQRDRVTYWADLFLNKRRSRHSVFGHC